ncbi:MAG: response regulator [Acidimicrobiales bacterium]
MAEPITVLVVDDEPSFREALRHSLKREGFLVHLAEDGEQALEYFRAIHPDIVLLDVMLPRMSGVDVCREIRAIDDTPVIMVSARSEEIDAVVGLEVGADDYVSKPYRVRELVARMRSVLRRADAVPNVRAHPAELQVGDLQLDRERHEVTLTGALIDLPLKEFQLLAELMDNVDHVVSRQDLINHVWGYDYLGDTKTLDVHIKRLRAKVEADPAQPRRIVTVRGVGYKLSS